MICDEVRDVDVILTVSRVQHVYRVTQIGSFNTVEQFFVKPRTQMLLTLLGLKVNAATH